MKVSISSTGGTNRLIELADILDKMEHLSSLFIPFYSRKHRYLANFIGKKNDPINIDPHKVKTNLTFSVARKIRSHHCFSHRNPRSFLLSEMFDKWVAGELRKSQANDSNIMIAEAVVALHTLREAKKQGMLAVLDTTNSHISNQTKILEDEYNELGITYNYNPPRIIKKGIQEYDEADYIIARSSYVKNSFIEENVPSEKLFVVPSGVNQKDFRQVPKEDKTFRIIYCGLSSIKKGTHYLLRAYSELQLRNAELWLVGSVLEDIHEIMEKYRDHYKLVGFIPRNQLYKYYSQGSIFVLPSLEEGLAKVMVEAMACGLPVIATINSGAEDVIRDGIDGFVIPAKNTTAIKEKILYMYENQHERIGMGENAQKRVNEEFTLEAYAQRMIDTLHTISKGGS